MNDIYEVRHENLMRLLDEYGSVAELNERIGKKRNDAALSIVKNRAIGARGKPRQMGNSLARLLENKLGLGHGWMDTDHTGMLVSTIEEESDGIIVQELANTGSMGDSPIMHEQDVLIGQLTLSREFVRRLSPSSPFNLKVITGYGDSMRPTIDSGDKVLVDEGDKDLRDGVYVLRSYDTLFIKRVTRSMKGKITISSDNPSVKLSEELDGTEELEVIGRVIYVWKGFFT